MKIINGLSFSGEKLKAQSSEILMRKHSRYQTSFKFILNCRDTELPKAVQSNLGTCQFFNVTKGDKKARINDNKLTVDAANRAKYC